MELKRDEIGDKLGATFVAGCCCSACNCASQYRANSIIYRADRRTTQVPNNSRLYRKSVFASERECVEHLFMLYERMCAPLEASAKKRPKCRAR